MMLARFGKVHVLSMGVSEFMDEEYLPRSEYSDEQLLEEFAKFEWMARRQFSAESSQLNVRMDWEDFWQELQVRLMRAHLPKAFFDSYRLRVVWIRTFVLNWQRKFAARSIKKLKGRDRYVRAECQRPEIHRVDWKDMDSQVEWMRASDAMRMLAHRVLLRGSSDPQILSLPNSKFVDLKQKQKTKRSPAPIGVPSYREQTISREWIKKRFEALNVKGTLGGGSNGMH